MPFASATTPSVPSDDTDALLAAILDHTAEGVIAVDEAGRVVFSNAAATAAVGPIVRGAGLDMTLISADGTLDPSDIATWPAASGPGEPAATFDAGGLEGAETRFAGTVRAVHRQIGGVSRLLLFLDSSPLDPVELAALRKSDEHLRALVDNIPVGFVLFDADDRLVLCNDLYRQMYARHADRLVVGGRFEDMLRAGVAAGEFSEAVGREEAWIAERLEQHRNPGPAVEQKLGDGRWLRIEERPTPNGGSIGLRTDITAIKDAEEKARAAHARLMDAIESVSEAFVIFDAEDRLVLCNEKYREFYRLSPEQCEAGTHYLDLARHAATAGLYFDQETSDAEWRRNRLASLHDVSGTHIHQLGDGRWVQIRNRRTRDGGIVGIRTDISERKETEEEVRKSEERFRAVVDNSPGAILLKDLDGRFRIINKRFEEWYALSGANLIGKTSFDVYAPEDAARLVTQDQEVLAKRSNVVWEYEIPFADGKRRTVSVEKFPVLGSDGEAIGIGSITTDVTRQRRMEAKLQQAQKMEAIGQLTGGIAHDFNNLLAIIKGNAELALEDDGTDVAALMKPLLRATKRGADLTHRLLAFSRRQALLPEAIDVAKLLDSFAAMLGRSLGETIEIATIVDSGLGHVWADPGQLENALLNLAINARDAMPDGGRVTIEVHGAELGRGEIEAPPGRYVRIVVRDSGKGMDASVAAQAFNPFFTTKAAGQGTGLGLSMVYGFAKQSGGTAMIESRVGQGTAVTLYLPCVEAPRSSRAEEPVGPNRPGEGEAVLVVEDNPDVREMVELMLGGLNYRVRAVASAAEARAALAADGPFDLLLSDVVLAGGVSGPELAADLSARDPNLRVLFMSGYAAGARSRRTALPEGAALLHKPFRRRELAKRVRAVLESGGAGYSPATK